MKRQPKLIEIREIGSDPYSMKGDPLEDLGTALMIVAACIGVGAVVLIVEIIMYIINYL